MKLELLHQYFIPPPEDMKGLSHPVNSFSIKFVLIPNLLFVLQNHLDNIVQFFYIDSLYWGLLTNIIEWFCFVGPNYPYCSWTQCFVGHIQYPTIYLQWSICNITFEFLSVFHAFLHESGYCSLVHSAEFYASRCMESAC